MKRHERIEQQHQERETIPTPGESSQDEETTPGDCTEDLWECLLAVTSAEDPFPGGLINSEGSFFLESSSSSRSTALLQFPESDRAVDTLALTDDAGNGITACSFSSSDDCLVFQPSPDNLPPWERLMLLHCKATPRHFHLASLPYTIMAQSPTLSPKKWSPSMDSTTAGAT